MGFSQPTESSNSQTVLPRISPWLVKLFNFYLQSYVPKHFHAFAMNNGKAVKSIDDSEPLIVYLNHASWWDPLVALQLVSRYFPSRHLYAPIDAEALKKYPIMRRLGFFPVQQDRLHGAGDFLKTARSILNQPNTSIWLTPEGRFTDPRQREIPFQPGLAHLVSKLDRGFLVPLAIEYPFWEERLPELLCRFGEPLEVREFAGNDKEAWSLRLVSRLRESQAELENLSLTRNSDAFDVLLSGRSGIAWTYDSLRRVASLMTGSTHEPSHGSKLR